MEPAQSRIKAVFEALGTTANAFARANALNVPTIYGFVNGTRSPSFDTLVAICAVEPKISAEYLLRGEGNPLRNEELAIASTTIEQLKQLKAELMQSFDKRIKELER